MPEIIDAIFRRRTIRRLPDRPVEHAKLEHLRHAATAAPSACNS